MSTLCICGVCIPYSAIVPFALYCLKWLAQKLNFISGKTVEPESAASPSCCATNGEAAEIRAVNSMEEWAQLVKGSEHAIVVKFSASWCKPCHRMQPTFANASTLLERTSCVTVDVDDCDDLARDFKIAILPTFVHFAKEGTSGVKEASRYVGSNEHQLIAWMKNTISES